MKARVKATGEIIEVKEEYDLREAFVQVFYSNEEDPYEVYEKEELDFNINGSINPTIDYWTRLEHQYAGMAMQGILSNQEYVHSLVQRVASREIPNLAEGITKHAEQLAHALVEKMKEERK